MSDDIDFYFDIIRPYAYIADKKILTIKKSTLNKLFEVPVKRNLKKILYLRQKTKKRVD